MIQITAFTKKVLYNQYENQIRLDFINPYSPFKCRFKVNQLSSDLKQTNEKHLLLSFINSSIFDKEDVTPSPSRDGLSKGL